MQKYRGNKFSHTGVFRSGSKAKRGEERERLNDGNNNGQLRIAGAYAKPPGPKS